MTANPSLRTTGGRAATAARLDEPMASNGTPMPPRAQACDPPQYSKRGVLGVWAAAAVPMGLLSWVIAPEIAGRHSSERHFAVTLIVALTIGLVWQAALVAILVLRESRASGSIRLRDRLWLRQPQSPTRRGGRLWLWVVAYGTGVGLVDMLMVWPTPPAHRDLGLFLASAAGKATFHHAWGLYALVAVELAFNTFLGEEMLFRGLLLPRMRGAFGRADWIVNSVLFGCYHLHEPWAIPNSIATGLLYTHPAKRFRSAWMGIVLHSIESVFFLVVLLRLVTA